MPAGQQHLEQQQQPTSDFYHVLQSPAASPERRRCRTSTQLSRSSRFKRASSQSPRAGRARTGTGSDNLKLGRAAGAF
eukprot:3886502-Rhodomonas_salina.1